MRTLFYRLLSWIRMLRNGSIERSNVEKIWIGKVQPLEADRFKIGNKVLTTQGIGTITNLDRDDLNDTTIYIISIRGGSAHIRERGIDLLQFYVHHDDWKAYVPVSFSDYHTLEKNNSTVAYRITNRKFAKVLPEQGKFYIKN